jgi:hypothetical protein
MHCADAPTADFNERPYLKSGRIASFIYEVISNKNRERLPKPPLPGE